MTSLRRTRSASRLVFLCAITAFITLSGCSHSSERSGSSYQTESATSPDTPNIIIILADDIGFGDIGANGNNVFKTPNIDLLAQQGTNFLDFSVPSPVCSPSRAGLMTGQYPDRHGVFQHFASVQHHIRHGMPDWLAPNAPSYARQLQQVGYNTGHFGKWHLTNSHVRDAPLPINYGFDVSYVFNGPGPQTDAVDVFARAEAFIRDNAEGPFLVNLWIHETHTPHYPDPDLVKAYNQLDEQAQIYAATVTSADRGVGRIMSTLKELDIDQNTLVLFFSDNGPEHTGDEKARFLRTDPDAAVSGREPYGRYFSVGETAGLRGKKRDLYEGGVRVPFIMSWPGVLDAGKVDRDATLNAIDIFPTLIELSGAPMPDDYSPDGESFAAIFERRNFQRQSPLFWQRLAPVETGSTDRAANWAAIRAGDWKLYLRGGGSVELYNLGEDRGEARNMAESHPETVERLSEVLEQWQSGILPQEPTTAISVERDEEKRPKK